MAKNKYLEDAGIAPFLESEGLKTAKPSMGMPLKEQRKLYGFDERETWEMRVAMAEWIYSHICMYEQAAGHIIDLTYHEIRVGDIVYTQGEAMDKVKELLVYFLKHYDGCTFADDELFRRLKEAMLIWAELCLFMWW